jgi:transcriptional regulator with XRE-family HTH domain
MTTTVDTATPKPTTGSRDPADGDELRRRELAAFLRNRRERLTPEQLGLPALGRRRTPGLRREEVAGHAGVGVTWYTWLEQARDINVSEQVLDAIARTLQLDPHERSHLFTLAGSPLSQTDPDVVPVSDQVREIMTKLEPFPACVTNGRTDLLAYNRAYTALLGDLDGLPFDQRNSLWLTFTSPTMRHYLPDWEHAARRMVARFRSAMADHVAEPAWKCLVRRLQAASPEFGEYWQQHDVAPAENLTKHVRHPQLGALHMSMTNMWLSERYGLRMMTYSPFEPETAAAFDRLLDLTPRTIELTPAA